MKLNGKRLFKIFVSVVSVLAMVPALAADKVNSKESLRICKVAIEADLDSGLEIKYRRKPATSVNVDVFKHWINATTIGAGDKKAIKILCETSRTGELVTLQVEEGRWKF